MPRTLQGLSHYDKAGPAITISGSAATDRTFTFAENPGGSFVGMCDRSGVLRGEFMLGKRKEPFELRPRPAAWPGLYRVRRATRTAPNHPSLPTNPAKRRAMLAEAPELGCNATDESLRVFGLASAEAERRVNTILEGGGYDAAVSEIQQCDGMRDSSEWMSLIAARSDLLVVSGFSSQNYGGIHPMNGGLGVTVIDLLQGRRVELADIVDPARLRDIASECLPVHVAAMAAETDFTLTGGPRIVCGAETTEGRYLWGCDKDDRAEPNWALLPEGIVIGSWALSHASAALEGQGPVLAWDVLARAGVLKVGSPLARLWAGVQPASADALACSGAYAGDHLRTWVETR